MRHDDAVRLAEVLGTTAEELTGTKEVVPRAAEDVEAYQAEIRRLKEQRAPASEQRKATSEEVAVVRRLSASGKSE